MTLPDWFLYLAVVFVSTLSPGPAVLLSVSNALAFGLRASALSSLGNVSGLLCLSGAACLGVGTVLQSSPRAFTVLKVLGAVYLVYLGIRQWRGGAARTASEVPQIPRRTPAGLFVQGMVLALSNPKAILFFAALFPQFLHAGDPLLPQFLGLTGTLMVFSFGALMSYAALAGVARGWLATAGRGRTFQRLAGAGFVLLGLLMLRL